MMPLAALPLHVLAATVGYSRVHTGVHYPGDVLAGAVLGAMIADLTDGLLPPGRSSRGRRPRSFVAGGSRRLIASSSSISASTSAWVSSLCPVSG